MTRFFRSCFGMTGEPGNDKNCSTKSPSPGRVNLKKSISQELKEVFVQPLNDALLSTEFMAITQNSVIPKEIYCVLSPSYRSKDQLGHIYIDVREKILSLVTEVSFFIF